MSNKDLNFSLKLLAKSSVIVLMGVILSKVLAYVYRILIARHYGPETYGLFSLAIMATGWILVLVVLGLDQGLLRYIAIYRGKRKNLEIPSLYKSVLTIVFITSIVGGSLLFLFSDLLAIKVFSEPNLAIFLKLFSISIPLTAITGIILVVAEAHEQIGIHTFLSKILPNVFRVATIIVLIIFGIGQNSIPISYLVSGFVALFASYVIIEKYSTKLSGSKIKWALFNKVFLYSWPLMFFTLAASVFFWTDTFFIGIYRSVEDVGIYNAAIPIAFLLMVSIELFIHLLFPIITKEYALGRMNIVGALSKQVGKWILIITIPLFALLVLFPGAFINILFGTDYLPAANALRILVVGTLVASVLDVSRQLLFMKGKSKLILLDIIAMVVVNILLNALLIPKYGLEGAGISTAISLIALNLVYTLQARKHLSIIPLKKKMFNVLLAALVPSLLLILTRKFIEINFRAIILVGILFLAVYISMLFLFKSFDENDKMIIGLFRKKMTSLMGKSFVKQSTNSDY